MNAIKMLESQHREVEGLFGKLLQADATRKGSYFTELADQLAIHATIEERHFYPAVRARRTEDILLESLEEHLAIKRVLADLLKTSPADETFEAKVTVLKETVEHHVKEEEHDLFPKVKRLLGKDELEAIGQAMAGTMSALQGKSPRNDVPKQTREAPSLPRP